MKKNLLSSLLFVGFLLIGFCSCAPKINYKSIRIDSSPVIDGIIDDVWLKATLGTVNGDISGENNRKGIDDLFIRFRCMWDTANIYFLFEVLDDVKLYYSEVAAMYNDQIILYFAPAMKKADLKSKYICWAFLYGVDTMTVESTKKNSMNIQFHRLDNEKGYTLEIEAPWKEIGLSPKDHLKVPFNIEISDMDKPSNDGIYYGRETNMSWTPNLSVNSWARPKEYGNLVFVNSN
jgi:cellulose/xylan binding protein with CBM9 domain